MNIVTRNKLIKIADELNKDAKEANEKKDMDAYHLTIGKMLGILIAFEHDLAEAKEEQAELKAEKEK